MVCPRCKNIKFKPTKDFKSPVLAWNKESYDQHDTRIKFCIQCGYVFRTVEKFMEGVEITGLKIMRLVDDYQIQLRSERKISKQTRQNLELFRDE